MLNAFYRNEYGSYWFESGTPAFLVKKVEESGFDAKKITDEDIYATELQLMDYRVDNPDLIPLFYQTGYLTIKGYNKIFKSYLLGYPNDKVKYGLNVK